MPKNISGSDEVVANLALPVNQFSDANNIMRYRKYASELDRKGEIRLDGTRISNDPIGNGKGFLKFSYKGKRLAFYYDSKKRLEETIGMIKDEFILEESGRLNVKGRKVVDIGAYVADTAISFVAKGARHVYAFEPYPYYYKLGLKNIKANGLGNKITIVNAGCASISSKTTLNRSSVNFTRVNSKTAKEKSENRIDIIGLDRIVGRYNLKNAALKVDCEGCEYDIILKTDPKVLRCFSEIQIEYHYGYSNLEKRLASIGFKVRHTRPSKKYNFTSRSFMVLGFINAKRL